MEPSEKRIDSESIWSMQSRFTTMLTPQRANMFFLRNGATVSLNGTRMTLPEMMRPSLRWYRRARFSRSMKMTSSKDILTIPLLDYISRVSSPWLIRPTALSRIRKSFCLSTGLSI